MAFSVETIAQAKAFRISPTDTNYFVMLFDQKSDGIENIFVIEIFKKGGATPPNEHGAAHEFFHVLHGEGVARCDGKVTSINQFVGNYRLLSYALDAYGLGDQINSTALIKQVLERINDRFAAAYIAASFSISIAGMPVIAATWPGAKRGSTSASRRSKPTVCAPR